MKARKPSFKGQLVFSTRSYFDLKSSTIKFVVCNFLLNERTIMLNIVENNPLVLNYGDGQTFLTVMVTPLNADDKPSFAFSVLRQSKNITKFLAENRYLSENGLIIAADEYPEFKDSTNHVYLRGSDSSKDFKVDVTRFVGVKQRNAKMQALDQALSNFVKFVQNQKAGHTTGSELLDSILSALCPQKSKASSSANTAPEYILIQLG